MQQLQEKMTDARRRGDMYDSAVLGAEMQKFMKEKNVNPVKNILPIMCQFPIFASMYLLFFPKLGLPSLTKFSALSQKRSILFSFLSCLDIENLGENLFTKFEIGPA